MEKIAVDDVRARLMENNENFRRLAEQHSHYDRRLEELSSRRFPSPEEQIEEARLKRLKLHLKDRMSHMVSQYRDTVH